LMTHTDVPSYCSTNTARSLSKISCELCLVTSHNISSNNVARSPGAKLKASLENYLLNLVRL
jgi:hypothetical protein